jgi:3-hydroxyacyl-CoA dehydrogenase/enoyl-CoA hydratase/3-hydroxybutyryl-CoA epimerase
VAAAQALVREGRCQWNITDLKDRLLYRQAVETARCLSENVLTTVHDANIGSIFGIGFPGLDRRRHAVHLRHGH